MMHIFVLFFLHSVSDKGNPRNKSSFTRDKDRHRVFPGKLPHVRGMYSCNMDPFLLELTVAKFPVLS